MFWLRCTSRYALHRVGLYLPVAVAACCLTNIVAVAQSDDLPKAETILDRYIEVTGGRAAYEKLKNRVSKGTFDIAAAGIKGTIMLYQAAPDKLYSITELPGMGTVKEGSNGTVAWEQNPMMGPHLKQGKEKATALREAAFNAELHWRKLFKKVQTKGIEDVNGKPAYKVELTPVEGNPETRYFDKESGLHVKTTTVYPSQMGDIPAEVLVRDYKEVDGVKIAHKIVLDFAMQEMVLTFEKIEHNVDLPKDRFDLPADIKALLKKTQSGGE